MTDDLPVIRADLVKISTLARGFTQLVLEIPSEQAAKAIELLGVPTPGNSLWVATAPLGDADTAEQPNPPAKASAAADSKQPVARKGYHGYREKKRSRRAGGLCADSEFWRWLGTQNVFLSAGEEQRGAASWLRHTIGIASRAMLDGVMVDGKRATKAQIDTFLAIEEDFRQWAGYEASPERIPDPPTRNATAGQDQARTGSPQTPSTPAAASTVASSAATPAAESADKRQGIDDKRFLTPDEFGELCAEIRSWTTLEDLQGYLGSFGVLWAIDRMHAKQKEQFFLLKDKRLLALGAKPKGIPELSPGELMQQVRTGDAT